MPDVALYRWDRIPRDPEGRVADDFFESPDIAVEIVSPRQSVTTLVRKCLWYVAHGAHIAVLVDPADESVLLFRRDRPTEPLRGAEAIDLGDVLPGLTLTAQELFDSLRL